MEILVCIGRACAARGGCEVERILREGLPQYEVLASECLDDCANAPVIKHDEEPERDATPEKCQQWVAEHRAAIEQINSSNEAARPA
jgi:NADH:ubiquinone oxidoreductase subunit E